MNKINDYLYNKLLYKFKKQLICNYKEVLDENEYIKFIGLTLFLLSKEPEFLIFVTPIVDRIMKIINNNRYDYNIHDEENEIIRSLNTLKNYTTEELKEEYRQIQREERVYNFESDSDILYSIAYDSVVIDYLEAGNLDNIKEKYFIASTNYLLENFPNLYSKNRNYIDITINKLNEIYENNSNRLGRKEIKIIKKQLAEIKK